MIRERAVVFVLTLVLLGGGARASAQGPDWTAVRQQNAGAMVYVFTKFEYPNGFVEAKTGSGFIVHPDGWILTCDHVVPEEKARGPKLSYWVSIGGSGEARRRVVVEERDPDKDLALLLVHPKPATALSTVEVDFERALDYNQSVYALGFPAVEAPDLDGVPGTIRSRMQEKWITSAPINHGNSGGPVFSENGLVVGVALGGRPSSNQLNVVLPITYAKVWMDEIGVAAAARRHVSDGQVLVVDKLERFMCSSSSPARSNAECVAGFLNGRGIHAASVRASELAVDGVAVRSASVVILHRRAFARRDAAAHRLLADRIAEIHSRNPGAMFLVYSRLFWSDYEIRRFKEAFRPLISKLSPCVDYLLTPDGTQALDEEDLRKLLVDHVSTLLGLSCANELSAAHELIVQEGEDWLLDRSDSAFEVWEKLRELPDRNAPERDLLAVAERLFLRDFFTPYPERNWAYGLYAVVVTRLVWQTEVMPRLRKPRKLAGEEVRKQLRDLESFMADAVGLSPSELTDFTESYRRDKRAFVDHVPDEDRPDLLRQRADRVRALGASLGACGIEIPGLGASVGSTLPGRLLTQVRGSLLRFTLSRPTLGDGSLVTHSHGVFLSQLGHAVTVASGLVPRVGEEAAGGRAELRVDHFDASDRKWNTVGVYEPGEFIDRFVTNVGNLAARGVLKRCGQAVAGRLLPPFGCRAERIPRDLDYALLALPFPRGLEPAPFVNPTGPFDTLLYEAMESSGAGFFALSTAAAADTPTDFKVILEQPGGDDGSDRFPKLIHSEEELFASSTTGSPVFLVPDEKEPTVFLYGLVSKALSLREAEIVRVDEMLSNDIDDMPTGAAIGAFPCEDFAMPYESSLLLNGLLHKQKRLSKQEAKAVSRCFGRHWSWSTSRVIYARAREMGRSATAVYDDLEEVLRQSTLNTEAARAAQERLARSGRSFARQLRSVYQAGVDPLLVFKMGQVQNGDDERRVIALDRMASVIRRMRTPEGKREFLEDRQYMKDLKRIGLYDVLLEHEHGRGL